MRSGSTAAATASRCSARVPFEVVAEALPGEEDDTHARFIEVSAEGGLRVAGIYLPNGNSGGEEGFAYKLRWMERLRDWTRERLDGFEPCAVLGDFNVCPTDADLAPGALPPTDALVRPESRSRFRALLHLGMTDALRALHPEDAPYTYWDYGPAFEIEPRAADRPRPAQPRTGGAADGGRRGHRGAGRGAAERPRARLVRPRPAAAVRRGVQPGPVISGR